MQLINYFNSSTADVMSVYIWSLESVFGQMKTGRNSRVSNLFWEFWGLDYISLPKSTYFDKLVILQVISDAYQET